MTLHDGVAQKSVALECMCLFFRDRVDLFVGYPGGRFARLEQIGLHMRWAKAVAILKWKIGLFAGRSNARATITTVPAHS